VTKVNYGTHLVNLLTFQMFGMAEGEIATPDPSSLTPLPLPLPLYPRGYIDYIVYTLKHYTAM
jgi:hypothetical protein